MSRSSIDYEAYCELCGEYEDDCMCWLDDQCAGCGKVTYQCDCDIAEVEH